MKNFEWPPIFKRTSKGRDRTSRREVGVESPMTTRSSEKIKDGGTPSPLLVFPSSLAIFKWYKPLEAPRSFIPSFESGLC